MLKPVKYSCGRPILSHFMLWNTDTPTYRTSDVSTVTPCGSTDWVKRDKVVGIQSYNGYPDWLWNNSILAIIDGRIYPLQAINQKVIIPLSIPENMLPLLNVDLLVWPVSFTKTLLPIATSATDPIPAEVTLPIPVGLSLQEVSVVLAGMLIPRNNLSLVGNDLTIILPTNLADYQGTEHPWHLIYPLVTWEDIVTHPSSLLLTHPPLEESVSVDEPVGVNNARPLYTLHDRTTYPLVSPAGEIIPYRVNPSGQAALRYCITPDHWLKLIFNI